MIPLIGLLAIIGTTIFGIRKFNRSYGMVVVIGMINLTIVILSSYYAAGAFNVLNLFLVFVATTYHLGRVVTQRTTKQTTHLGSGKANTDDFTSVVKIIMITGIIVIFGFLTLALLGFQG